MHVESGIAEGDPERQNKKVQQLKQLVEVLAEPKVTHQEGAPAESSTTVITKRRPDSGDVIHYILSKRPAQTNNGNGRSVNGSPVRRRHSVTIIEPDTG